MRLSCSVVCAIAVAMCAGAQAPAAIVPIGNADVQGDTQLNTVVRDARTYQFTLPGAEIADYGGNVMDGLTWRIKVTTLNPAGSWPSAPLTFPAYDIYIGQLNGVLGSPLSTTFAQNVVAGTEVQVRSGALTIPASGFANYGGTGPNPFGTLVDFTTPFSFDTELNYVVTIRHQSSGATDLRYMDAVTSGGDYRAMVAVGYTPVTGGSTGFTVTDFHIVPEPAGLALLGLGLAIVVRRRVA